MRAAVLADVGQPVYHVGDEAIGRASVEALQERDVSVLILSRDPSHTRQRFPGSEVASSLELPWPPEQRERRAAEILAAVRSGRPERAGDDVARLVQALRSVDALVLAGGGNLTSLYGWLLSERTVVASIARELGLRVVLSGQTIGPPLTDADAESLADALRGAQLLGVRDRASRELLASHGVDAEAGIDDASFVASDVDGRGDGVVVTLSPSFADAVGPGGLSALAESLDRLAARLGEAVHLVPHMATPGSLDEDEEVHAALALRMSSHVVSHRIEDALESARRTRAARLVITSRFHPAVFGLPGAAVIALAPDGYAAARLRGLFCTWGLEDRVVHASAVLDPRFDAAIAAEWDEQPMRRDALSARSDQLRSFWSEWWDALADAMRGRGVVLPELGAAVGIPSSRPLAALATSGLPALRESALRQQLLVELDHDRTHLAAAESEVARLSRSRALAAARAARRLLRRPA